jgi:hypothetical protein
LKQKRAITGASPSSRVAWTEASQVQEVLEEQKQEEILSSYDLEEEEEESEYYDEEDSKSEVQEVKILTEKDVSR